MNGKKKKFMAVPKRTLTDEELESLLFLSEQMSDMLPVRLFNYDSGVAQPTVILRSREGVMVADLITTPLPSGYTTFDTYLRNSMNAIPNLVRELIELRKKL